MRISLLAALLLLAISPIKAQEEIFLSTLNNLLYRLDLSDCSYQQIGTMPGSSTDISFHPNGNLYSVNSTGSLFEVDVTTGNATLLHTFEPGATQLYTALTISAEGIFYVCGLAGDLYSYDLDSDSGNFLGNVGFGAEGDLTFYEGELYMAAENDNIVLVDIDDPSASTIAVDGNVSGRIFGVVSYAASCEDISVYALTDMAASVYEVNFEDGTLDFYCSIPLQVSGGASTFEFLGSNPVFIDDLAVSGFDCGAPNGSISITASGGVGNLTYSLDGVNYQNGNEFSGLPLQQYIVYVADEVGCVRTEIIVPDANAPAFTEVRITNTVCGEANGQIEVVVEGGVPPYDFYLNGVLSTTGLIVGNLSDGNYQLEIIDAAGCSINTQANLGSASPPVILDAGLVQTSCGENNGSLTITVQGGLSPLRYSINGSPFQVSPDFSGLAPGDYSILVEDQSGCSDEEMVSILPSTTVLIDSLEIADARCELPNGSVAIYASGGQQPLQYQINAMSPTPTPFFSGLGSGDYQITVQDAAGCEDATEAALDDSPPVEIELLAVQPSACLENNGQVSVRVSGGVGNLEVRINGALAPKPEDITDLAPGDYLLEVEDEFGCANALSVRVPSANCPVYLPNVFSPNQDGRNDYFGPLSVSSAGATIVRFQVFDRWGGLVFEQQNGLLGDDKFRWNGRKNGDDLGQGIYVYFLELEYEDGERSQLSGDVMLLR